MAPTKKPVPKTMEKPIIEKPISKMKSKKKKNYHSFSIYIFKLLRTMTKDIGISRKSVVIMNHFVNDMLERIAAEAGRLAAHSKKSTLGSREVQAAVKLLLPGELAKHANIEGVKAITLYNNSRVRDANPQT